MYGVISFGLIFLISGMNATATRLKQEIGVCPTGLGLDLSGFNGDKSLRPEPQGFGEAYPLPAAFRLVYQD